MDGMEALNSLFVFLAFLVVNSSGARERIRHIFVGSKSTAPYLRRWKTGPAGEKRENRKSMPEINYPMYTSSRFVVVCSKC